MTSLALFPPDEGAPPGLAAREELAPGALLLRGYALAAAPRLLDDVLGVLARAPLRHLVTPFGQRMSVAMSNCGPLGWVSDRRGYRYSPVDPDSGRAWPPMPPSFLALARDAAAEAGFADHVPDCCLVNRYEPGTRLGLHIDGDERDAWAPIVSVSLGLGATFLFGGLKRSDATRRVALFHGDVVVFGGPSRRRYHGVLPVTDGAHEATGRCRINLTFRKAR